MNKEVCPVCGVVTQRLEKHVFTYKANEPAHAAYVMTQRELAMNLFNSDVPVGKQTDLRKYGLIISRKTLIKIWKEQMGEDAVRNRANWSRSISNTRSMIGNKNKKTSITSKERCPICGRFGTGLWSHLCKMTDEEHAVLRKQQELLVKQLFNDETFMNGVQIDGLLVSYRVCINLWKQWFTAEQREARANKLNSRQRKAQCGKQHIMTHTYKVDKCLVCGKEYASLWTHLLQRTDDAHRLLLTKYTDKIIALFNDMSFTSAVDPHERDLPIVYNTCVDVWRANFGVEATKAREKNAGQRLISAALHGRKFTDEWRTNLSHAQHLLSINVKKYVEDDHCAKG